jgi:glutamate-1-semialdehyde 2,1-aminomutase
MGAEAGRYRESAALFARAERVIPGGIYGHQSPRMLVPGAYPSFFARADGARLWDVDGNEYLDLVCGYGPIVLGHNHPAVDAAAAREAANGRCYNGPGRAFVELAERLVGLTPWAAWAVFAKNGSDVCTWAVQVARAATGRAKILAAKGAYHGARTRGARRSSAARRRKIARTSRPTATTTSRPSTGRWRSTTATSPA